MEVEVIFLCLKLSDFFDVCQFLIKFSFDDEFDEISSWVEKQQQKKEEYDKEQIFFENVSKVFIVIINGIKKFKSGDFLEVMRGVLDIILIVGNLFDGFYGLIIEVICIIIGIFFIESELQQLSVVDQLVKVVYDELVYFNKRLQDQKYDGFRCCVLDQKFQL